MKTILATAYAVNPYKGSEDGMGWNFVLQIARFQRVIAVTRRNNRPHIERFMAQNPDTKYVRIQWIYHDLPEWTRWWKRGPIMAMPYFLLWQRSIPAMVRRLGLRFDIAHNLNFHNDWTPSYLWRLGKPMVWGPVGHHPPIPTQFLENYGWVQRLGDRLRWWIKQAHWKWSPALAKTRAAAAHILCMHSQVIRTSAMDAAKCSLMPSVATEPALERKPSAGHDFQVISAGRLLALKGFDLTIEAFAGFVNNLAADLRATCKLTIVGAGPERDRYLSMVMAADCSDCIEIVDWMPREQLLQRYAGAAAFLFPSHEGAGMVVAEALSYGVPVICLDNSGPGEFVDASCGIKVAVQSRPATVAGLVAALKRLHDDPQLRSTLHAGAKARHAQYFHWNRRGEALQQVYQSIHP